MHEISFGTRLQTFAARFKRQHEHSVPSQLDAIKKWATHVLNIRDSHTLFVLELHHTDGDFRVRETVIRWLGGGCGGHSWSLGKPAVDVTRDDVVKALGEQTGSCRHG